MFFLSKGFTLTEKDGSVLSVSLTAETVMQVLPADGDAVTVYDSGTPSADGTVIALGVASALGPRSLGVCQTTPSFG